MYTITQAFNAGMAPFQEIVFLTRGVRPVGRQVGAIFVPTGVLYHRADGRIGLCVGGDGVEGWQ